ncbi:arabinose 5-phosphate isomerase [Porphyromonas crevioricanis JCM 15906]|uniref:Arabinose 5-phosphate isomerase n=2 Tax=Porphyromonas crevioricanis TaxID=393921 RepID=T1CSY7_9PORP|nr:arabinose 5-phosphate isomerase [Porphyromonas crevioricanis JCM 15906]SJZ55179.1 arabinose-5-phosphate isomerase [Porphyromonas crevioricanis]
MNETSNLINTFAAEIVTDQQIMAEEVKHYSVEEMLRHEADAISRIPQSNDYDKAVAMIIEQVHSRGGRLITSGMGKAGQIAANMATTFCSTGTPAYFLHPSEAQHGDLGIIRKNDILLLVSNSGRTREVLELVELAKGLVKGIPMLLITGNTDCELAQMVNVCLSTGNPAEVCPLGLTPTTSTTVMTVIGDVLVVRTMQAINFGYADYAMRHHGGYLGSKSRDLSTR